MSRIINQVKKTIKQGVAIFYDDAEEHNMEKDVAGWLDDNPTFVIDQIALSSSGDSFENLVVLYHYEATNDERI